MVTPEQYVKKNQHKKIDPHLQRGIGSHKLDQLELATHQNIKTHEKKVLSTVIKDEEILNMMVEEENLKKLSHRFEHRLRFTGEAQKVLFIANRFNATTSQVKNELDQTRLIGRLVEKAKEYEIKELLEKLNYKGFNFQSDGQIKSINLTTIFRKG